MIDRKEFLVARYKFSPVPFSEILKIYKIRGKELLAMVYSNKILQKLVDKL